MGKNWKVNEDFEIKSVYGDDVNFWLVQSHQNSH